MARYFFSYAGIDRPIAEQIVRGLKAAGIDVFWDQQGIGWGQDWQEILAHELQTCDAYILLLGPQGIRRWVSPEVKVALCRHYEQNLPIFILLHSEVEHSQIPLFLSFSQHRSLPVKLDDVNFFHVLVRELKEQVGESGFERVELPEGLSCPYPGLESFSADYQTFFFGRQQETAELLTQFVLNNQRWLQIEGNSGVGKSSLMLSGLLPAVKAGWLDGDGPRQNWHIAIMRPGKDPCENLATAIRTALQGVASVDLTNDIAMIRKVESPDTPHDQRQTQASDLSYAIKCALPNTSHSRLFLVVDQLEEAITLTASDLYRTRFDSLLAAALNDPDCPLHLVTSIRSDFLLYFSELPELQKTLQQSSRYYLKPIGEIGLLDAVATPLRRTQGWSWPNQTQYHQASQRHLTLPETIVADALAERDAALPLASNLMNRLWALSQDRREPSFVDYYVLGGIGGALALSLDTQLDKLSETQKSQARAVLLALVQDNDNAPATRRTISKQQALDEIRAAPGALKYSFNPESILNWLSGIRVNEINIEPVRMIKIGEELDNKPVTNNSPQTDNDSTVDLIHEILLRQSRATGQAYCKTLSQWVADNRQRLKNRNLHSFGLYDVAGNVEEWTQDCPNLDYENAPNGGIAWEDSNYRDCDLRILRGGSFIGDPYFLSSGGRSQIDSDYGYNYTGFRLAQDFP